MVGGGSKCFKLVSCASTVLESNDHDHELGAEPEPGLPVSKCTMQLL